MQKSTETRWILTSTEVEIMIAWFKEKGITFDKSNAFPRQDYYLKLLENTQLGIKIREPKLVDGKLKSLVEIKTLLKDNGCFEYPNYNNECKVNTWLKYSFETIGDEAEIARIIELFGERAVSEPWLKIEKDRLLIKYDVDRGEFVNGDQRLTEACGVELTRFRIEGKEYYTLGLEAFSSSWNEMYNFKEAVEVFFTNCIISGLKKANSFSYPEIIKNHFVP